MTLVVLGGLPGTGKTSLARAVARALPAVHVRIDTLEQAVLRSPLGTQPVGALGYGLGMAVAADNLALGAHVVADCVNPVPESRDGWRDVARAAGVPVVEVHVTCADPDEHRRRVESRTADIAGHRLPTWPEVTTAARAWAPWPGALVLDTAHASVEDLAARVVALVHGARPGPTSVPA